MRKVDLTSPVWFRPAGDFFIMTLDLKRFKQDKFIAWLKEQGCEMMPTTNKYELLRWRGKQTGVLYTSGKTSGEYATQAIRSFLRGEGWDGAPVSTGRSSSYAKFKKKIIERDGTDCFYCGLPLNEDITLEHLIPLTAGGPNKLSNMVLAHFHCNSQAGHKTIVEKVRMAIDIRIDMKTDEPPPWD